MGNDEQKFSLKGQINKRKTQEMIRVIEDQRIARMNGEPTMKAMVGDSQQAEPTAPASASRKTQQARQISQTISDPKRTTGTLRSPTAPLSASMITQQAARVSQTMPATYAPPKRSLRVWLAPVAAAVALLLLIVSVGALFTLSQVPAPAQSAKISLPVLSAADVINQLKLGGMPIINSREFAMPSTNWKASQEFQINVSNSGNNGTFIVLSYPSQSYTIPDIIRARNSTTFKEWQITTGSNLILLTSPDSDPTIGKQVQQQILHFLVDPARAS